MKKILLLLIIIFTCSCNYKEVNDLAIVSAIAIDYKDQNYEVTYEIINTYNDDNKSYTLSSSNTSLEECFNELNNKSSKNISLSHVDILLVSKSIRLLDISDYLIRNTNITTNFYLVLSDNPKDILNHQGNDINSISIKKLLINDNINIKNQFDYLIASIIDNDLSITIPYITLEDTIILKSYAIYSHDKFNSIIDDSDLNTYKLLTNKKNINYYYNDNIINIYSTKVDIILKDNKYQINLNIKASILKLNDNDLNYLEKSFSNLIRDNIYNFILNNIHNNIDILGFKKVNKINNKNDDYLNYIVNLNLNINKKGFTRSVIK